MRRRSRNPLEIRRLAYALMALATVAGGLSGAKESAPLMIVVLVLALAATATYVRAADFLLDFDFRNVRRQALLFTLAGLGAAFVGCVVASQLLEGRNEMMVRVIGYAAIGGGIAIGLSGLVSVLWSFAGTYAGEQIEKRSQEEW